MAGLRTNINYNLCWPPEVVNIKMAKVSVLISVEEAGNVQ